MKPMLIFAVEDFYVHLFPFCNFEGNCLQNNIYFGGYNVLSKYLPLGSKLYGLYIALKGVCSALKDERRFSLLARHWRGSQLLGLFAK
jgi:hypothetical protein